VPVAYDEEAGRDFCLYRISAVTRSECGRHGEVRRGGETDCPGVSCVYGYLRQSLLLGCERLEGGLYNLGGDRDREWMQVLRAIILYRAGRPATAPFSLYCADVRPMRTYVDDTGRQDQDNASPIEGEMKEHGDRP